MRHLSALLASGAGALLFLYAALFIGINCVWGWAVKKIVENKGYRENWFWWGFFFGIIALLVALTKPDKNTHQEQ